MIKKILLGFGYFTWIVCNLSIVYAIGYGVVYLSKLQTINEIVLNFTIGVMLLFLIVIISIGALHIISMVFGDEKVEKKIDKIFNIQ